MPPARRSGRGLNLRKAQRFVDLAVAIRPRLAGHTRKACGAGLGRSNRPDECSTGTTGPCLARVHGLPEPVGEFRRVHRGTLRDLTEPLQRDAVLAKINRRLDLEHGLPAARSRGSFFLLFISAPVIPLTAARDQRLRHPDSTRSTSSRTRSRASRRSTPRASSSS